MFKHLIILTANTANIGIVTNQSRNEIKKKAVKLEIIDSKIVYSVYRLKNMTI